MSYPWARSVSAVVVLLFAACGGEKVLVEPITTPAFAGASAMTGASARRQVALVPLDTMRVPTPKSSRVRRAIVASTNPQVATIDADGLITAHKAGFASLSIGDGVNTDVIDVSVHAGPARIAVSPSSYTELLGSSVQLSSSVQSADGQTLSDRTIYYSSQDPSVASVTGGGLVSTRAGGQTNIEVRSGGAVTLVPVTVQSPATVTSFVISPKAVSVVRGGTVQFAVRSGWSDGSERDPGVSYSVSSGSISVNGILSAPNAVGQILVIANCLCGRADTSRVTVTSAPVTPSVQSITIAPKTVTIAPGATVSFSTTALWTNGSTAVPLISYSATSGSVTAGGVYTAPSTAGTYKVIVFETAGPLRDTATVTVQAAPPPAQNPVAPPPPASGQLFTDTFESGGFSTRQNGVWWSSTPWAEVTNAIAHTGSKSVRFRQGESREWAEMRFSGLPRMPEVFVQFYLYMPSGLEQPYVGPRVTVPNNHGNDKFFRLWGGNPESIRYGASTWDANDGTSSLGIEYRYNDGHEMWLMGEGVAGIPKLRGFIGSPAYQGRWVEVRIRCKVASPANNDGVIQVWIDRTLALNATALASYAWGGVANYFEDGYLLGWANNGFPTGQNMYLDDFTVSATSFPP